MNNCIPFPGTTWAASVTSEALQTSNSLLIEEQEAAAALLSFPAWSKIDQEFERATGHRLQPWQLIELAASDLPTSVISMAIEDTRKAPRPSFFYLRAILRRFKIETERENWDSIHYIFRNQMHQERCKRKYGR